MPNIERNLRLIGNDNAERSLKIGGVETVEHTELSLLHIRKVHGIKSRALGSIYSSLGDDAWQILCEVRLRNMQGMEISLSHIRESIGLQQSLAIRYVDLLRSENLIARNTGSGSSAYRNLYLTPLGHSKVDTVLKQSSEAFAAICTCSQPRALAV